MPKNRRKPQRKKKDKKHKNSQANKKQPKGERKKQQNERKRIRRRKQWASGVKSDVRKPPTSSDGNTNTMGKEVRSKQKQNAMRKKNE